MAYTLGDVLEFVVISAHALVFALGFIAGNQR